MKTRPIVKLCVLSLMYPIREGPTNPPMFPTELMSAMPAAAPTPPIRDVARVQNGPNIEASPSIASDSAASDGASP